VAVTRTDAVEQPRLTLLEPLRHYACNLRGCCCRGWRIPFRPRDFVRLALSLPDDGTVDRLTEGLVLVTDEDHRRVERFRFQGVGEDERCRFLADDERCALHLEHGADVLPDLCLVFPAFVYVLGDRWEVHHDGLCPEVIGALAASPAPLRTAALAPPHPPELAQRLARGGRVVPEPKLYGEQVGWEAVLGVRDALVAACADESRPALETLRAAVGALARLQGAGPGAAEGWSLQLGSLPAEEFVVLLFSATAAHDAGVVATFFWRARRFLFDLEHEADDRWEKLAFHLEHWQEALLRWVEPEEARLRPLLLRYLGLLWYSAPLAVHGEVAAPLALVPVSFGLALRVTAAAAACLEQPATERELRLGIATAEYAHRSSTLLEGGLEERSA